MAEPTNARTFQSWEDAFQYPIPVVRKLEKRLRADIEENREKLRTLVGSSYRDLLGTAERIIDMDEQMQEVEAKLGDIGLKCNTRALERIGGNTLRLHKNNARLKADEFAFASQLPVLQGCSTVISRLLRRSGSSLLAAKVLIIARLLHKSLTSSPSSAPLVDTLRDKLASLRGRLLRYIDKIFANPDVEQATLIESMHAFCLATSSTPTDVLRHFHHARLEAITDRLKQSLNARTDILASMKLFISTLEDTQSIFPKRLAAALETSKSLPLLEDPTVLELPELQLDIHGRWIEGNIQRFTPQPKHDQLQRSSAESMLRTWAANAIKSFLVELSQKLAPEENLQILVEIRRELLELWLASLQLNSTSDAADIVDDLRKVMMERIANVARSRSTNLRSAPQAILHAITHWQTGAHDSKVNLWDQTTSDIDTSKGASQITQRILDRCHGRSRPINEVLNVFEEWVQSIQDIQNTVKTMKEQRWDENPEDVAEEILAEPPQVLLSNRDPKMLEETLASVVHDAFETFREELQQIGTAIESQDHQGDKAIFVLRSLRELRQRMPKLGVPLASSFSASLKDTSVERTCRKLLASSICEIPIAGFHKSIQRYLKFPNSPARPLWEGNPPLPVQPSPAAFKFLRAVVGKMGSAGHDLWNVQTVQALKVHLVEERTSKVLALVEEVPARKTDAETANERKEGTGEAGADSVGEDEGDKSKESDEAASPLNSAEVVPPVAGSLEKYIQLLFDIAYLNNALQAPSEHSSNQQDEYGKSTTELSSKANIDKSALQRLEKSAADYWRKTYLLFALLA